MVLGTAGTTFNKDRTTHDFNKDRTTHDYVRNKDLVYLRTWGKFAVDISHR